MFMWMFIIYWSGKTQFTNDLYAFISIIYNFTFIMNENNSWEILMSKKIKKKQNDVIIYDREIKYFD
jgi:hypothetical protein